MKLTSLIEVFGIFLQEIMNPQEKGDSFMCNEHRCGCNHKKSNISTGIVMVIGITLIALFILLGLGGQAKSSGVISEHPELLSCIIGATHYANLSYGIPYWVPCMIETVKIGNHTYYKER